MSIHQQLLSPSNHSDLRIDDTNRSLVYKYLIMRHPQQVIACPYCHSVTDAIMECNKDWCDHCGHHYLG